MSVYLDALVRWQQRALEAERESFAESLMRDLSEVLGAPFAWLSLADGAGAPKLYASYGWDTSAQPTPWLTELAALPLGEVLELSGQALEPFASLGAAAGLGVRLPGGQAGLLGVYRHRSSTTPETFSAEAPETFSAEAKLLVSGAAALLGSALASHEPQRTRVRPLAETGVWLEPETTERQRTEAAVRRSEERFRTIFASGPLSAAISTFDGRIVEANARFLRLFGYGRSELLDLSVRAPELWHDPAQRGALLETLRRRGFMQGVTLKGRTKSGEVLTVLASLRRLELGGEEHVLTMLEDITERSELEAESAALRLKLAQARESERVQLARELHDGALQTLIGISYGLAETRRELSALGDAAPAARPVAEPLQEGLEQHRQRVLGVARSLRLLIAQLRPAGIEEFGLAASLHNLLTQLRRSETVVQFHYTERALPKLPLALELAFFRVAQEALRNALKHAAADNIWVGLEVHPPYLHLSIDDDGRGYALPTTPSDFASSENYGLLGMTEQLGQFGGTVDFGVSAEGGFRVTARMLLAADAASTAR